MEFDSIIYIAIAIVLAIINAIAQKKKKAGQQSQPVATDDAFESIDSDEDTTTQPYVSRAEESLDPFELLFGSEEQPRVPEPEVQEVVQSEPEPIVEEVQLSSHQQKMQEVAQKLLEKDDVNIGIYDLNENTIAESAIGDALTQEEELELSQARSIIAKEFDVRKAIIYSEIIRPKYFSAGVKH